MKVFNYLLKRAGITKAELARRFNISPRTVSAWKDEPPMYAIVYLELLIDYNRVAP